MIAGKHAFICNDLPPAAVPFAEGKLELLHARVDIHQPLYRHQRVGARLLHAIDRFPGDAPIICTPFPGVQLQGLPCKAGSILYIDGAGFFPLGFNVFA